ncbi:MAG: deoxynucleoside kinase [Deinococcota bacterium]
MYVVIAGNIGVGKSSLTKVLAARCALQPMLETVDDHPYLEDFYNDMPRYAFHSQIVFLTQRLEQYQAHIAGNTNIVQDRSIYEDAEIFARHLYNEGIMSRRDFSTYWRMYRAIRNELRTPDLLIYLRASLPTLRARIHQRGRDYEASIHNDYLLKLNALYEDWIARYSHSKVLTINADKLDFMNDCVDLNTVLGLLEQHGLTTPVLRSPPAAASIQKQDDAKDDAPPLQKHPLASLLDADQPPRDTPRATHISLDTRAPQPATLPNDFSLQDVLEDASTVLAESLDDVSNTSSTASDLADSAITPSTKSTKPMPSEGTIWQSYRDSDWQTRSGRQQQRDARYTSKHKLKGWSDLGRSDSGRSDSGRSDRQDS